MALLVGARDLKIDPTTGDLVSTDGDLVQIAGIDAIAQACRLVTELFQGEWFLDEELGIPYYQSILGIKAPSLDAIRSIFRAKLLTIGGVLDVLSMNVSYNTGTRQLSVTWRVSTDLGELAGGV